MLHYVGDASEIHNIAMAGGGAFFFHKAVRQAFPRHKVELIPDAVFANVMGFYLPGVELARKGDHAASGDHGNG